MAWDDWFRKDSGSKDNIFKYWWRTTIPGAISNFVSRVKNRGYQFGDFVTSMLGMRYDPNSAGSNAQDIGNAFNDLTGTTAANQHQAAMLDKEQAFTAEQNQLNRDFQLYMSNTALQRMRQDAEAAGINPLYLVQHNSGAGVASGSGQTAVSAPPASGNSAAAVGSAINALSTLIATVAKIAR